MRDLIFRVLAFTKVAAFKTWLFTGGLCMLAFLLAQIIALPLPALWPRMPWMGRALQLLVLSIGATALLILALPGADRLLLSLPLGNDALSLNLGVQADLLSLVMTSFIAFIGWVVLSYSLRSLRDDPKLPRFIKYLCLALAGPWPEALSPSLLQFALAWVVVSVGLTRLLLHDRARRGAQLAARSKFLVSRLGDLAMLIAIVVLLLSYGSTDLAYLAEAGPSTAMTLALCALVAAVVFKTAQLPFQHWLIGTFEAPTVSA